MAFAMRGDGHRSRSFAPLNDGYFVSVIVTDALAAILLVGAGP
jgi:hypothetical protein